MLLYEIRGLDVVEVTTGEDAEERVEFHGCDRGSAEAVGRALAEYWDVPVVVNPHADRLRMVG